jgi:hypothetical protein
MDGPVTLDALNAALDSLLMQEAPPYLAEDDITIMRLSRRAGCGSAKAKTMLSKWVTEGKVEYIGKRREERGHLVEAWRLKPEAPPSAQS